MGWIYPSEHFTGEVALPLMTVCSHLTKLLLKDALGGCKAVVEVFELIVAGVYIASLPPVVQTQFGSSLELICG